MWGIHSKLTHLWQRHDGLDIEIWAEITKFAPNMHSGILSAGIEMGVIDHDHAFNVLDTNVDHQFSMFS